MLRFNSALLSATAAFCGRYAPWQAVRIEPAAGGIVTAASDQGKVVALGFDPRGEGDTAVDLLPTKELLAACNGIRTAERDVAIDGPTALVTTYRKSSRERKEFPIHLSAAPLPSLHGALRQVIERWGQTPQLSETAGRYDSQTIERAIRGTSGFGDAIVLSAFDGGPLRLCSDGLEFTVLVMPQTAQPIPPIPPWIQSYATQGA